MTLQVVVGNKPHLSSHFRDEFFIEFDMMIMINIWFFKEAIIDTNLYFFYRGKYDKKVNFMSKLITQETVEVF